MNCASPLQPFGDDDVTNIRRNHGGTDQDALRDLRQGVRPAAELGLLLQGLRARPAWRAGPRGRPLTDDDILTAADIAEIHEQAQGFRGERVDLPVTLSLSRYEMVCSRSEYVVMAETLLRLSRERDELLVEPAMAQKRAGGGTA